LSLMPVPSEQDGASCANCGAALVADQRYCLSCGRPASPVRLAFLDVLQSDQSRPGLGQPTIEMSPAGYVPVGDAHGASGWLRRYSGLLGLFAVLLMCLIVGLLVGHWVTQGNKTPAKQVVEVKGLSAAPAAAATSTAPTSTTSTSAARTSKTSAKEEAEAAKAAAKETKAEKAPPPKPVKVAPAKIKKLTNSSGKQHQEEINALGATPIETG
jgi:cell division septation protein DedD